MTNRHKHNIIMTKQEYTFWSTRWQGKLPHNVVLHGDGSTTDFDILTDLDSFIRCRGTVQKWPTCKLSAGMPVWQITPVVQSRWFLLDISSPSLAHILMRRAMQNRIDITTLLHTTKLCMSRIQDDIEVVQYTPEYGYLEAEAYISSAIEPDYKPSFTNVYTGNRQQFVNFFERHQLTGFVDRGATSPEDPPQCYLTGNDIKLTEPTVVQWPDSCMMTLKSQLNNNRLDDDDVM